MSKNHKKIVLPTDTIDPNNLEDITQNLSSDAASLFAMMQKSNQANKKTDNPNNLESITQNLPSDAASLLTNMQNINKNGINIKDTIPCETSNELKKEIQDSIKKVEETSLIRSQPKEMQKAYDQKKALDKINNSNDLIQKLAIHEVGVALGLTVGITKKEEAINIIKNFTKSDFDAKSDILYLNDLDVSIFFIEGIVSEIKFSEKYKGYTSKKIGMGDTLEEAIEAYGQPKMKSPKGAIWDGISVFCRKGKINTIKLKK